MNKVNAETLIGMSREDVWAKFDSSVEQFEVVCPKDHSSQPLVLMGTQIVLTWYGLKFIRGLPGLKKLYPHVEGIPQPPVRYEYFYQDDFFNPGLQLKWMNRIFWQVWEDIDGKLYPEELAWLVDEIVNDIYNLHVSDISEYIGTMNILDDIEIINDPRARESHEINDPSPEGIKAIQDAHIAILDDEEGVLRHNNLVQNWKAGLPKRQQTIQKVGVLGYRTEGDSSIIPAPVMGSFTRGLGTLRDVAVEACSSKKAQIMTTDPVADTEYFARRLQLLVAYVRVLSRSDGRTTELSDCGNSRTLAYTVGRYDLENLAGVYMRNKNGTEVMLKGNEKALIGHTIDIRSPAMCGHRHEGKVCGRCMGGIAWSMDPRASLGHQSVIEIAEPAIQSVISTKHEDQSATGEDIIIPNKYADLLKMTADKKGIRLAKKLSKGWDLVIPRKAIPIPSDVYIEGAIDKLNAINFSEVKYIRLVERNTGQSHRVNVSIRKTPAYLSTAFLRFMATKNFTLDEKANYIIPLDGLDPNNAFLRYPVKHRNTLDFMNDLAAMIESKGDTKDSGSSFFMKKMSDFDSPDVALNELARLVYSRFSVNISHLGVVLLAIMCRGKDDASIPTIDERSVFLQRDAIIDGRSVITKFAFQGQTGLMKQPRAYTVKNRMPVAMDIILR